MQMIISFITSGDVLIWTGLRLTESTWWLQMTWHRKGTRPSATIMLIGVWQVKLKESYYRSACYNPGYTSRNNYKLHDDAIKWKHFPRYWPFVRYTNRVNMVVADDLAPKRCQAICTHHADWCVTSETQRIILPQYMPHPREYKLQWLLVAWWLYQMETFPHYWPFVRGVDRWPVDPLKKASDAELWCFLWSAPEQTAEQTIEMPVIWDSIALIMTSLQWGYDHELE